ncbi:MAG: alpha/beta hydrolase [Sterolibacteriaceae bacterium]|nr:alpha/beta hydrolase [Candidatus Methylophosphatis haderslevensis]
MRMHDIKANVLKALIAPADVVLRRVLFNSQPPPVARVSADVEYGPDAEQRLDIVEPHREGVLPVLLYFHRGGWISGDKASHERICRSLATNGFVTFNVNYRLAPRHRFPAQAQDVALAIDWVRRHAQRYGADASRVVLAGDSAGAHLASWYATSLGNPLLRQAAAIGAPLPREALKGIVLFYGVYDLARARGCRFPFIRLYLDSLMDGDQPACADALDLASPARHVTAGLPPVFLCAGEKDGLFPESVAYAEALRSAGANLTTLFFTGAQHPEATHGFLYLHRRACTRLALDKAGEFLARCVGGSGDASA